MEFLDYKFLETIDQLTTSIHSYGHYIPQRPSFIQDELDLIPDMVKTRATDSLIGYMALIKNEWPGLSSRQMDLAHFEIFCKVAGFKTADPFFMEAFEEGDIIEAYSREHQQVFRNLEFFRCCSYDLYTMTVVPWPKLFYRPEEVQRKMIQTAQDIVDQGISKVTNPVPQHIIKECYADHTKTFLYTTKQAGCLLDSATREARGYLSIIRVSEVDSRTEVVLVN